VAWHNGDYFEFYTTPANFRKIKTDLYPNEIIDLIEAQPQKPDIKSSTTQRGSSDDDTGWLVAGGLSLFG